MISALLETLKSQRETLVKQRQEIEQLKKG
jgi:hypothetical protein